MAHVLAIDQSTSATKVVLFDAHGGVLDRATREHRQIYPQPGWVEHDAEEIWQNLLAAVGEIAERSTDQLPSVAALAITNQRETVVVFDRRTGQPLCNAIVWQCRRGDPLCGELRAAGYDEMVARKTGLKLDTYFSGSKLKWLVRERPDIAAKLQCGEALVGTIDTYLIYRLTNHAVFATDPTNASRTLFYDVEALRWDKQLCEIFRVPMQALAEVRDSAAHFGGTDVGRALPTAVPICGVMGDSQAAAFAQRCFQPGMAKATFGSGTSVLLNIGHRYQQPSRGTVVALAYVLAGQPTYALEGIINYSSATIAWLKDQLGLINDAAESEPLAGAVTDCSGVYFVPAFSGLSAPYWSPDARAAILGMTAHTRREHVVRAALESIAYQIRDVLQMFQSRAGIVPSVLRVDGGPTRNALLMQITADITQTELEVTDVAEASAWGAAMAALLGTGIVGSPEELAALPRSVRRFQPRLPPADADLLYSGWRSAVQRVL